MQVHYDIMRGIPRAFELLAANASESASLKKLLEGWANEREVQDAIRRHQTEQARNAAKKTAT